MAAAGGGGGGTPTLGDCSGCIALLQHLPTTPPAHSSLTRPCCSARQAAAGEPSAGRACKGRAALPMTCAMLQQHDLRAGQQAEPRRRRPHLVAACAFALG